MATIGRLLPSRAPLPALARLMPRSVRPSVRRCGRPTGPPRSGLVARPAGRPLHLRGRRPYLDSNRDWLVSSACARCLTGDPLPPDGFSIRRNDRRRRRRRSSSSCCCRRCRCMSSLLLCIKLLSVNNESALYCRSVMFIAVLL